MKELTPLAVAFTVLAGLVVWREATRGATRTLTEEAALVPLQVREFAADDASKIVVTAPGAAAPAYTLERQGKGWRSVSAFTAPASGAGVGKLLDALAKAEGEFRSDDEAALAQFDLTPAKAVDVRVLDKDGKDLVHLAIGRTSSSRGAFVRNLADDADDSKAYALIADVRGLLGLARTSTGDREPDKPEAGFFHEKEFPQFKLGAAKRVELVAPGRRVEFENVKKDERDKEGEWKPAAGGPDAPMKKDGVEKAIASLGGQFHPTALVDPARKKEIGLDAPRYRIAVTSEDGTTRAAVGSTDAACEHFYVRLDAEEDLDVVYEASDYEFHQMFPAGAALFELPKLDVPKDGPTRVVVERSGRETIEITRKGTKPADEWSVVRPAWPLAAKSSTLRSLGGSLPTISVIDYLDDAAPGDPEALVRFGAAGAPDDQMQTLHVGAKAPAGKDRLAVLPGRPGRVFVVQQGFLDRISPEPLSLFEPKILHDWRRDDVIAVRAKTAEALAIVRDGGAWRIEDAAGAKSAASTKAVEAWLDRLLGASVTGVLSGVSDFEHTPLVLERADGAPREIGVSVTKDGTRVVVLGGEIFTVDEKDDLLPDRAALEEKTPPKDEKPKDDGEK